MAVAHAELEGTVGLGGGDGVDHRDCGGHFILLEGGAFEFGGFEVIVAIPFFVFGGRAGEEGREVVHGHLVAPPSPGEGVHLGLSSPVVHLFVHRNWKSIK